MFHHVRQHLLVAVSFMTLAAGQAARADVLYSSPPGVPFCHAPSYTIPYYPEVYLQARDHDGHGYYEHMRMAVPARTKFKFSSMDIVVIGQEGSSSIFNETQVLLGFADRPFNVYRGNATEPDLQQRVYHVPLVESTLFEEDGCNVPGRSPISLTQTWFGAQVSQQFNQHTFTIRVAERTLGFPGFEFEIANTTDEPEYYWIEYTPDGPSNDALWNIALSMTNEVTPNVATCNWPWGAGGGLDYQLSPGFECSEQGIVTYCMMYYWPLYPRDLKCWNFPGLEGGFVNRRVSTYEFRDPNSKYLQPHFRINGTQKFIIRGTAVGQGTVTPAEQDLAPGQDAVFNITADADHHLVSVVGDVCTPVLQANGTWRAVDIQQPCSVVATFVPRPVRSSSSSATSTMVTASSTGAAASAGSSSLGQGSVGTPTSSSIAASSVGTTTSSATWASSGGTIAASSAATTSSAGTTSTGQASSSAQASSGARSSSTAASMAQASSASAGTSGVSGANPGSTSGAATAASTGGGGDDPPSGGACACHTPATHAAPAVPGVLLALAGLYRRRRFRTA